MLLDGDLRVDGGEEEEKREDSIPADGDVAVVSKTMMSTGSPAIVLLAKRT
jgi:hypothetical protein